MHFVVFFVLAAVQVPNGGIHMMVLIVGVIVIYHGRDVASMCLQRSLLCTCISRTPRGGVQSQKVFWFAGACIGFACRLPHLANCFHALSHVYGLGLVCYRGSPCSSSSSLNGTCRMHYLCGWLVIRASPLLCVVIRHIGTSRSLMLPHETPNFDHCFGPSRNLVPCRLTSALSTPS